MNKSEYSSNPSKCRHCGNTLPFEKRKNTFCNSSCAASFNNKIRVYKNKKVPKCLHCGKELTGKNRYSKKFCNNKCQLDFQHNTYITEWKSGNVDGIRGRVDISKHIKKYMLEKVGHACQKCGWSEINIFTGHSPLELHHKDGDFTNNSEGNLEILCPNCHSLTENYGSRNLGHGRTGR